MTWFGTEGAELERTLGLPHVTALTQAESTMDEAHALAAAGAPAGSLVVAEEQTAGRGRGGRAWTSVRGSGLWLTLVERPVSDDGLDVLSLRVGLHLAPVLDRWTASPVRLKWPNDLFVSDLKLAGVLIEARWRGARADWVAIGVGVNLRQSGEEARATLQDADVREVLAAVVPALRAAAATPGALSESERAAFAARDLAAGQRVSHPARGTVRGIAASGELLIETDAGICRCRAGSLVLVA
ncbi:MAG TPA: biotin--[acetyl-CoA-carboxylase] ligase [Gemmatimonadaceae bacterium]|nr:biotin--[acetyl-CoA-carboxylase] ligase [Gemmatimonadaceae bacterium]